MSILPIPEQIYGFVVAISIFVFVLALVLLLRTNRKTVSHIDGVLHIDKSNPEFDNYYFEMITPLDDLPKKETVTLQIKLEHSQKN